MRFLYAGLSLLLVGLFSIGGADGPASLPMSVREVALAGHVPNTVSVIYLGLRLYDTLFEVLVFSVAIFGVSLFLDEDDLEGARVQEDPPILVMARGAGFFSLLLGCALAFGGHLEPGGGFAAGVAAATGLVLQSLGENRPFSPAAERRLISWEKGALLLFLGGASLALFRFPLPPGPYGTLFSGGWIMPLNLLVGLKVALGGYLVALLFLRHRWIF